MDPLIPHWFQVTVLVAANLAAWPALFTMAKAEIIANHKEIRNATDR